MVRVHLGVQQKMNKQKKLAVLTEDLGLSQRSFYLIDSLNNFSRNRTAAVTCYTTSVIPPVMKALFPFMNQYYFSSFNGTAIATSIDTAKALIKTKNNTKRFLYLWDLEWIRNPVDFDDTCSVLRNPDINIITRSESHKKMVENYANTEVCGIVDDWNTTQLEELIWI